MPTGSIWRATGNSSGKGTEALSIASGDIIQFEVLSALPDTTGHVNRFEYDMKQATPENEKAFADTNEVQFAGFEYLEVTITGFIKNPPGSAVAVKLKVWELEAQKINNFTKGRFGLRMDDFPIFNVTPYDTSTGHARGYSIGNIKFIRSDILNRVDFVAVLRLAGDLYGGTGTNYDWST